MRVLLRLLAVCLCLPDVKAGIFSCGGFIRSPVRLDYSKIKVKLLTPEGHLKHEESCNADNGYYMLPVYNKGRYSVRVVAPEGWIFHPRSFDFTLDGETDKCSQNEDINFVLVAFAITGSVRSSLTHGPSGLALSLLQNGKVITNTATSEQGKFRFEAAPGEYTVASSPDGSVCVAEMTAVINVKEGPVELEPLSITGFPVTIHTRSLDGTPLQAASISLHGPDLKLPGCRTVETGKNSPGGTEKICSLGETNEKGVMTVACLPPGKYFVSATKPSFLFSSDMVPLDITSKKTSVTLQVSGFFVKGRVLLKEEPVADADILLDGQVITKTDSSGFFSLLREKEGTILLSAKAEHFEFSSVRANLSPNNLRVPDIQVDRVHLCGSIENGPAGKERESILLRSKDGQVVQSIRGEGENGHFCIWTSLELYTLSPSNAQSSLSPSSFAVDLRSAPLLNARFTHFKTSLHVKLTCIGSCESRTLTLLAGRTVLSSVEAVDSATFQSLSPAEYTVRVEEGGSRCWEQAEQRVRVSAEEPPLLLFVQSGFSARLSLSHPALVKWVHNGERQIRGEVAASSGGNSICLPTPGSYILSLESCLIFDRSEVEVSVPSSGILVFSATEASLRGFIARQSSVDGLRLSVKSPAGEREIAVSADGSFAWKEPLSSSGHEIRLEPHSSSHLFDPPLLTLPFNGECIENAAHFKTIQGEFVEGEVDPPVEGVQVSIAASHLPFSLSVLSDKNGRFRVGPLLRVSDLEMKAEKDGYSFSPGNLPGHLKSLKLSQLSIRVLEEGSRRPLGEVTLHLRGPSQEKRTLVIGEDGHIKLTALAPGTLIRAFLQEYLLSPSTVTVTMKEGEHEELEMIGKRVAYSTMGKIREMNGQAVADVMVRALSEGCEQHESEATTSRDGSFRIRGLLPSCTYRISPRAQVGEAEPPHCFPSHFIVSVEQDTFGLDMVSIPQDEGVELGVEVSFGVPPEVAIPSLRVSVARELTGETVTSHVLVSPVNVYLVRNLTRNGEEYRVRVEPEGASSPSLSAVTTLFRADEAVKIVRLHLLPSSTHHDVEISRASLLALPFLALVAYFIMNQEQCLSWLRDFASRGERPSSPPQASASFSATSLSQSRKKR